MFERCAGHKLNGGRIATPSPWQQGLVLCFFSPTLPVHRVWFQNWVEGQQFTTLPFPCKARVSFFFFGFLQVRLNTATKWLNWLSSSLVSEDTQKKRKRKILIYNISLSDISWRGLSSVSTASSRQWIELLSFATLRWKGTG